MRNLDIKHYTDDNYHCGPLRSIIGAALLIVVFTIPAYLVGHYVGVQRGIEVGIDRTHSTIQQAIREGEDVVFYGGQVGLSERVPMPRDTYTKARLAAARYEKSLMVRYRVLSIYGNDAEATRF